MNNHWRKLHVNNASGRKLGWRLQYGSVDDEGRWCTLLENAYCDQKTAEDYLNTRPETELHNTHSQEWTEVEEGEQPWPSVQLKDIVADINRRHGSFEREVKMEVLEKLEIIQKDEAPIEINPPIKKRLKRKMVK